jgi:hypothetical protein
MSHTHTSHSKATYLSPTKIIESVHNTIHSEWEWDADLFFICSEYASIPDTFMLNNIFDYGGDEYYGTKIYFSPMMYPPEGGLNGDTFSSLYLALQEAAKQSGYELHINGSNSNCKYLTCPRRRAYREPTQGKADGDFKQSSWKNDKLNTHGIGGQNGPRRRETSKPTSSEDACNL